MYSISVKKDESSDSFHAWNIKRLNETKQYTLMATVMLQAVIADRRLSASASKVWEYLYSKAVVDEELKIKIKCKEIALFLNKTERTIKRLIENLCDNGYLFVKNNYCRWGQRENTYYITLPEDIMKEIDQSRDRRSKHPPVDLSPSSNSQSDKTHSESNKIIPISIHKQSGLIHKNRAQHQSQHKALEPMAGDDKNVTASSDINVTPLKVCTKKEEKDNNNRAPVPVVVNFHSENQDVQAEKLSQQPKLDNLEEKITQLETEISSIYSAMTTVSNENKIEMYYKIRELSAEQESLKAMRHKIQIVTISNPDIDYAKTDGERKFSEKDEKILSEGVFKYIKDTNQQSRVRNEIIFSIRFGELKKSTDRSDLGIRHATGIALKLLREGRWTTPSKMISHMKR